MGPDETLTLVELIDQLNERGRQVQSLYLEGIGAAGGGFEARIREARDQPSRFLNGDIRAQYLAPDRMRLTGTKDLAGQVFDLGTDGERFWMYLPTERQMFYGTYEGMDPEAARQLPIRPDLVLQVLGVGQFDTDLLRAPVPMLRYNPDADAYMLAWAEPTPGPPPRWVITREVWYDRRTLLPTLVVAFSPDGDPILRAYLSQHEPIADSGVRLASRYDLYFPDTGTTMWLEFHSLMFRNRRGFPRPTGFNMPPLDAVDRPIDLDQPLRPGNAAPAADVGAR